MDWLMKVPAERKLFVANDAGDAGAVGGSPGRTYTAPSPPPMPRDPLRSDRRRQIDSTPVSSRRVPVLTMEEADRFLSAHARGVKVKSEMFAKEEGRDFAMKVAGVPRQPVPVAPFPRLRVTIALFDERVPAGFPSPAEGYLQRPIDLNELLIASPPSTFMFRVEGQSMIGAHIHDGDLVIVDRALEARDKDIVMVVIDGEFTVKRLRRVSGRAWLQPENKDFPCIELSEEREGSIWGVVTGGVRQFRHGGR